MNGRRLSSLILTAALAVVGCESPPGTTKPEQGPDKTSVPVAEVTSSTRGKIIIILDGPMSESDPTLCGEEMCCEPGELLLLPRLDGEVDERSLGEIVGGIRKGNQAQKQRWAEVGEKWRETRAALHSLGKSVRRARKERNTDTEQGTTHSNSGHNTIISASGEGEEEQNL
jgi:hypothetical protein